VVENLEHVGSLSNGVVSVREGISGTVVEQPADEKIPADLPVGGNFRQAAEISA
jgi:hypothetical protein